MTISSETRKAGPVVGNSVATSFTFNYKVFTAAEVIVTLAVLATGVESVLLLNSDYSVALNANQNSNPGGTVTYPISGSPMASTHTLTLTSGIDQLQETDIENAGGFFPQVIEDALDRSMAVTQQETEKAVRALKFPVSDIAVDSTLPTIAQRASKVLGFGPTGIPAAVSAIPSGSTPATIFGESLVTAANAAAGRAVLELAPSLHLKDKHGADIASAATINLDTATGDIVDVTGVTGITGVTLSDGVEKTVRFTGSLIITAGASLILPGGMGSFNTDAGDIAVFRGYAAGVVRMVDFMPINPGGIPVKLISGKGDSLWAAGSRNLTRVAGGADGAIPSALAAATTGMNWTQAQAIGGLRQFGLTLSNNAGDATNDIDIALGGVPAASNLYFMFLSGALTKQLDVAWAVGTNAGMRASGAAIANTTYHIFLIMRPDTGVVDIAADTSASGANIAANTNAAYTQIQRIGSIVRVAGVIKPFIQDKNRFQWLSQVGDVAAGNPGTAAVTRALTLPIGIQIIAIVVAGLVSSTVAVYRLYLSDLAATDVAADVTNQTVATTGNASGGFAAAQAQVRTDTSAQIRSRMSASDAGLTEVLNTVGWIDTGLRL